MRPFRIKCARFAFAVARDGRQTPSAPPPQAFTRPKPAAYSTPASHAGPLRISLGFRIPLETRKA
eukprot:91560-Prorocentrum_minimum.AAC.1